MAESYTGRYAPEVPGGEGGGAAPLTRYFVSFLVASTFLSSLWLVASPFQLLLLAALVAALAFVELRSWSPTVVRPERSERRGSDWIVPLAVFLPILGYLVLTWEQEFPFSGDHDYHLAQLQHAAAVWRIWLIPVLVGVGFLCFGVRTAIPAAGMLVVAAVVGWWDEGYHFYAVRYPGSYYAIASVWKFIGDAIGIDRPLNSLRLANVSSLVCWLWVLRPRLIGARPDRLLLPFAAYALLQKDVIYYFTSSYIEPWAIILILLATEHLIRFEAADGWKVLLLIGAAAVIKEQAILILPFYALATAPSIKDRGAMRSWILGSVLSAMPFVFYYVTRRSFGVWRTAGLADFHDVFDGDRYALFASRVVGQFGSGLPVVLLAAGISLVLAVRGPKRRVFAAITGAAVFQIVFFYCDRISVAWTGYPRFHLIPAMLFGAILLEDRFRSGRRALAGTIAIVAAMVPTLVPFFGLTRSSDAGRNFFEVVEAPIYFPLDTLVRAGTGIDLLRDIGTLRLFTNFDTYLDKANISAVALAYPSIAREYRLVGRALHVSNVSTSCRCTTNDEAVVGLFVSTAGSPRTQRELAPVHALATACVDQLQRSCSRSIVIPFDGRPWGALGSGVRGSGGLQPPP